MTDAHTPALDADELPFLAYARYRLTRDISGTLGWFADKWRSSLLFKLGAFALGGFVVVWVAAWFWLASDLPEADGLLDYQTPLPTVVRGAGWRDCPFLCA